MITIELTLEELLRVVHALQEQALRETTVALDLGVPNVTAPLYANLAEMLRQEVGI